MDRHAGQAIERFARRLRADPRELARIERRCIAGKRRRALRAPFARDDDLLALREGGRRDRAGGEKEATFHPAARIEEASLLQKSAPMKRGGRLGYAPGGRSVVAFTSWGVPSPNRAPPSFGLMAHGAAVPTMARITAKSSRRRRSAACARGPERLGWAVQPQRAKQRRERRMLALIPIGRAARCKQRFAA